MIPADALFTEGNLVTVLVILGIVALLLVIFGRR